MTDHSQRFWSKVRIGEVNECWEWQACTARGYGQFSIRGAKIYAHKYALYLAIGEGLTADELVMHSCDNKLCCNPAHLSIGNDVLNSAQAAYTHCPHGHEYTPENTYVRKDTGARECKECGRRQSREWYRHAAESS